MSGCAVIVGVGPALGASLARRFAQGGLPVALVARKLDTLEAVKKDVEAKNGVAKCYVADTTDEQQVHDAFKKISSELGAPEVLCYNAGPTVGPPFPPPLVEDMDLARFRQGLELGVVGAFIWCKELVPGMKAAKKGTILLTGATAAMRGGAKFSVLSPGKFALRSLSQTLAREVQSHGIHVAHIIVDGIIESERLKTMMPDRPKDQFLSPDAIAEEYWKLYTQDKSTWAQEIDLRPFTEKF